jgi:hypothetical protein
MKISAEGYLIGVQRGDKGTVSGTLVQSDSGTAARFYVDKKATDTANELLAATDGHDEPVKAFLRGSVFAGSDFETKEPNGRLQFKVDDVEIS